MVYRRKHAVERTVASGKVMEIYLTMAKFKQLKKGKSAWIRVRGSWLVINPYAEIKKTAAQLKIEKLEAQLAVLREKSGPSKANGGGA